ncbi:MAG: hypothetical protein WC692_09025 [Erythrobacter sp.]|jgi:ElaB/YqjD/DUF883 family membrane-anchored ribosome-binding protein
MAETTRTAAPRKRKTTAAGKTAAPPKPRQPAPKTPAARETEAVTKSADNRTEAKSRFNAALEEARAGAAALKAEGRDRALAYRDQAKGKSEDWLAEAKAYGKEAKVKGKELATEGKAKAGEGLRALSRLVNDNAYQVDEKVGAKYGDYARTASKSLDDYATRLDAKTVDDLVEDGREFVRRSPGKALGIAAIAGFLLSRLFRRSR